LAIRNIVKIDEERCNGCGQCVTACAEGAIAIIDGKAKLVSEIYCDGLGACLGTCPQNAIKIEQREAADFDEEATQQYLAQRDAKNAPAPAAQAATEKPGGFVCPGSRSMQLQPKDNTSTAKQKAAGATPSQLAQWPVQLNLLSPQAPYFKNAELLLVADCVPFAMGDFHNRVLQGRAIAVGCPKLDNSEIYIEKIAQIIKHNDLQSLSVIHMEVPCCFGLTHIAKAAIAKAGPGFTFEDVTISLQGEITKTETVSV
jgi:NAD-dependent dihydropyrimidine dehydrogenase PreA subunit